MLYLIKKKFNGGYIRIHFSVHCYSMVSMTSQSEYLFPNFIRGSDALITTVCSRLHLIITGMRVSRLHLIIPVCLVQYSTARRRRHTYALRQPCEALVTFVYTPTVHCTQTLKVHIYFLCFFSRITSDKPQPLVFFSPHLLAPHHL